MYVRASVSVGVAKCHVEDRASVLSHRYLTSAFLLMTIQEPRPCAAREVGQEQDGIEQEGERRGEATTWKKSEHVERSQGERKAGPG